METDDKTNAPRPPTATEWLEAAQAAAEAGEPGVMLEALAASGYLDGVVRRLQKDWGQRLPKPELDDVVAHAVDSAYVAVSSGRAVRNLGAWLWKAASNIAFDRWTDDYERRRTVDLETVAHPQQAGGDDHNEQLVEHRRSEAIRVARQLLPRIGQGQIVDVMTLVIDAVEQGIQDFPASTIADALGLSEAAVRSLLSRGFERLQREARLAGIAMPEEIPDVVGQQLEADSDV